MTDLHLYPLRWRLTLKIPLLVVVFMVAVAITISNVVLHRLASDQELHLQGLVDSYLDGLSAAIQPNLLRRDIWETFDALDRARGLYRALQTKYALVALRDGTILAASDPTVFPTGAPMLEELAKRFKGGDSLVLDEAHGLAWVKRTLRQDQAEIGSIVAEFDISNLLRVRREVLWTLILVNAGLVTLFSLAGYAVMRRLLRPISILTEHVDRARSGRFEEIPAALLLDDRTEIGALMASFNQLSEALRERQQLSLRLAKEEKVALLGKLASGMAHEVNNPLGGMLNVINTLRKHGDNLETRLRSLDLLERGLSGIANVVRATLAAYRAPSTEHTFRSRDLDDLQFLLQHRIGHRKLILQWSNTLPHALSTDGSVLRQVSLNLLLNACAASPSASRVEFSAEVFGSAVRIRVRDQGAGLPKAVRSLFEHPELAPNVPTENSGLGVWTVCRLVERAGGRIEILRSDGLGTDLRVTIPLQFEEQIDAVA